MEKIKLYQDWLKAKKAEDAAKAKRISIEEKILSSIEEKFPGKSKIFKEEGFSINVKKNESWKFLESWNDVRLNIPEEFRPEKIKFEVVEKGLDYLKEKEPAFYKMVSDCVEHKENKTSIKIEKKG